MKKLILIGLIAVFVISGCATMDQQSKTTKGAVYGTAGGAAAGAILGQVIGGNTKGTLIGAAAGAAIGGLAGAGVGHMMDKQEQEMRQAMATSEEVAVRREGDMIALTLKGDVTFDVDSDVVLPGLYTELDRIVPGLVETATGELEKSLDVRRIIQDKIEGLSMERLEALLMSIMSREFRFIEVVGAVLGAAIGLVQGLIFL